MAQLNLFDTFHLFMVITIMEMLLGIDLEFCYIWNSLFSFKIYFCRNCKKRWSERHFSTIIYKTTNWWISRKRVKMSTLQSLLKTGYFVNFAQIYSVLSHHVFHANRHIWQACKSSSALQAGIATLELNNYAQKWHAPCHKATAKKFFKESRPILTTRISFYDNEVLQSFFWSDLKQVWSYL